MGRPKFHPFAAKLLQQKRSTTDRIISMKDAGHSIRKIVHILKSKYNHRTSRSAVHRLLKRKHVKKDYKPRFDPSIADKIKEHISELYKVDNEMTTSQIRRAVEGQFNATISAYQVSRMRESLGLSLCCFTTRYGFSVRDVNKAPRVAFAQCKIDSGEQFLFHTFTDESMIQLTRNGRLVWCKPGDQKGRIKSKNKHPVLVWAGISARGATKICIMGGNTRIDSAIYQMILQKFYRNWAEDTYSGEAVLIQDNAPCHVSRSTLRYLRNAKIRTEAWPAESPDMNVIEYVWAAFKRFLSNAYKPHDKASLIAGIKEFWATKMDEEQCKRYISHIHSVLPKIVQNEGAPVTDFD